MIGHGAPHQAGIRFTLLWLPLAVLLSALPASLHAQHAHIAGIVRDAATREPLQLANIRIDGTIGGTTTDRAGRFALALPSLPSTLITSYIGYQSRRTLVSKADDRIVIDLVPSGVEMPAMLITPGDNPALPIIRNAIAAKEERRRKLDRYQLTSHSKLVVKVSNLSGVEANDLRADSNVTAILESRTDAWWMKPNHYKEVVVARKQSSFIPAASNIINSSFFITDFSADAIAFGDRSAITGPISERGISEYFYTLAGTRELDGRPVHQIDIAPRNDVNPLLTGTIYIADSSWALTRVDVELNDAALPTFFKRMAFRQNFRCFNDAFWMPVDVAVDAAVKIALVISVDIEIEGLSVLQDYVINGAPIDSVFDRTRIKVLKDADSRDSAWWRERMLIPNTDSEIAAYRQADSVKARMDSVRNQYGIGSMILGKTFSWDESRLTVPGVLGLYHYNRAEGHALSAAISAYQLWDPVSNVRLEVGRGFSDKRWKYDAALRFRLAGGARNWLEVRHFDRLADIDEDDAMWDVFSTTLSNWLAKYDYKDYYRSRGWQISGGSDVLLLFPVTLSAERSVDTNAPRMSDWSLIRRDWPARDIPRINEGALTQVSASLSFDDRDFIDNAGNLRRFGRRTHIPTLRASWIRTETGGARFDAMIYGAALRGSFNLDPWGETSYRLSFERSTGALPTQSLLNLPGSVDYFSAPFRFRTALFREYGGDRRAVAFVEHDFGDKIFRVLGLPLLDRAGWSLLIFGAAGWTDMRADTRSLQTVSVGTASAPYYEAGFGIDRILLLFRLDLAWRVSHFREGRNFVIGLSSPLTMF